MLEMLNERGLESIGRFYGTYRAVVISNDDPENMGRLLINVPQINNESIWAYPKGLHGSINTGFKYLTPEKSEIVFVEFDCGDPFYPFWSYCGWGLNEMPEEFNNNTAGIITPNGHKILLEEDTGKLIIKLVNPDNREDELASLIMDNGETTLKSKGDINIASDSVIKLMGGKVGTTLTDKLLAKINNLENEINQLKQLFNLAVANVIPGDGGAKALTTFSQWYKPVILTKMDDIENKEVLQ